MAHKKAGGSTKNGRDSHGQRRGMKCFGSEMVKGGDILFRQCGTKIFAGTNVGMGRDYTLYAKIPGQVSYVRRRNRKYAVVTPIAA